MDEVSPSSENFHELCRRARVEPLLALGEEEVEVFAWYSVVSS